MSDLENFHRVQIEHAANGYIIGTLDEWPALNAALRAVGYNLHPKTTAEILKCTCRQIVHNRTTAESSCLYRRLEIAQAALWDVREENKNQLMGTRGWETCQIIAKALAAMEAVK